MDAKPNDVVIKTKYGIYKLELEVINSNKIKYKRSYLLNNGLYEKGEYEEFRIIKEQISRIDNSKIVLKKLTY